jgi:hypothetical protein
MTEMLIVAVVEMMPRQVSAGHHYEDAVLELLGRHGGTVERRMRGTDAVTEVHVIRFEDRSGYETFMQDPDRLALRAKAGIAAPHARVIEVHDL